MATKKTAPKKEVKVEEIAAKTIDDISADIITSQNKTRAAFSAVGEALILKKEELNDIIQAIDIKKDELKDLGEKEKLSLGLQQLTEEFEDKVHEHKRAIKQINTEYEDKLSDLERTYQENVLKEKYRLEDEARTRQLALEEEDRNRKLIFSEKEMEIKAKEKELTEWESELGSFEDRVKEEVDSQIKSAQIKTNFEIQSIKSKNEADVKILVAEAQRFREANAELSQRLIAAEKQAEAAANRANAIAISSLDAESGKKALDELRTISHKQAESGKR